MAEHVINFVEGEGISIQASVSADEEMWDVEIASTIEEAEAPAKQLLAQLFGPLPVAPESSPMYRVPYSLGVTVGYTLVYASLHLAEAGSTSTTLVIEKSEDTDVFTPIEIVTLSCASTVHLAEEDTGLGTIESGNLLRFKWTAIGTGADSFHAQLEGTEA